ncbi:hypothetical protein [Spongiivirga citrea]|uniref:Uncharacterized protein n=1 Tax=Spongiivirga citrea TaxID=1481457 RepID=A0A6M0CLZ4_9FLAO|nr:hypothetical protein [Spongiivirga citrea]NER18956.1 hypothetical protein [Spongiivirga citrea]
MKLTFQKLLLLGILAELLILLACYLLHTELEETFRYAARYSGRLSAALFLYCFYQYASAFPKPLKENNSLRNSLTLFAVLHIIHFGFLANNVYLNDIPLVPAKLAGGALAYFMIVVAPFKLHALKIPFQLVYFYYVTLVMSMTYVARIKGDFEGAEPYWLHYLVLGTFILCAILFAFWMGKSKKLTK